MAQPPHGLGLLVELPGLPVALEVDDEIFVVPDLTTRGACGMTWPGGWPSLGLPTMRLARPRWTVEATDHRGVRFRNGFFGVFGFRLGFWEVKQ